MRQRLTSAAALFLCLTLAPAGQAATRDLTFEDRVKAQEAIGRVYYSHQKIGATKPFEEAVPRSVLKEKVRTYLRESVALDRFWDTPVTDQALHREVERIVGHTRAPERLQELFAALANDPFLIQECPARPRLVGRLTYDFFAADFRFHAAERAEAEDLLVRLVCTES